MSRVKLTCLVDNSVRTRSKLWGEHGLAFLIETAAGLILWDTGTSGTVLLHNLATLNVDPADLAAVVVSHGHQDHTGGLPALISRVRPSLPLYGHPALFDERFSRHQDRLTSVGSPLSPPELASHGVVLRLSAESQPVAPGVWTSGAIAPRPEPEGRSAGHVIRGAGEWVPDPYRDDMALVLELPAGLALICGCCHAGLLNTVRYVEQAFGNEIVVIAGGTHLAAAGDDQLAHVGQALAAMPSLRGIWLNHCSGEKTVDRLRRVLGDEKVHHLPAGSVLDLDLPVPAETNSYGGL